MCLASHCCLPCACLHTAACHGTADQSEFWTARQWHRARDCMGLCSGIMDLETCQHGAMAGQWHGARGLPSIVLSLFMLLHAPGSSSVLLPEHSSMEQHAYTSIPLPRLSPVLPHSPGSSLIKTPGSMLPECSPIDPAQCLG